MNGAPMTMTYASVVSRETIRIALTIAALNDLEVKAADILNAYISAPIKEKVWCALGQNLDLMQASLPLLSMHSMAQRALVQHFMPTWPIACNILATQPVLLTRICGTKR
jgi:hypothetical protein